MMRGTLEYKAMETEKRVERLKEMHELMLDVGDAELYWQWVACAVPDCPCDEDFEDIAEDEDFYKKCEELFYKLQEMDE